MALTGAAVGLAVAPGGVVPGNRGPPDAGMIGAARGVRFRVARPLAVLSAGVGGSAAAEVIMLTHNRDLHEVNLGWHPKAEDALWRPDLQQAERSQSGMWNVRYRNNIKRDGVQAVTDIAAHAPWLRVRSAF